MQLNDEVVITTPRPAATVVMLRDTPKLEVFMLKRHVDSSVLGGAYVFPGGKVDAVDAATPAALLDANDQQRHAQLGEPELTPEQARGLYVAALREAFEECGVLLTEQPAAASVRELLAQGKSFVDALAQLGLRLQTQKIQPWTRWITSNMPSLSNKRFDTRFFVTALSAEHHAEHDNRETTDSLWIAPMQALQDYWAGKLYLAPPQIMSLAHLARHDSVQSVLAEAASRPPPAIMSAPHTIDGVRMMAYPGDPLHPIAQRLIPGPLRMFFRNQRFEPAGGLDELLP